MHILDWSEHEPPQRRLPQEDRLVGGPLKIRLTLPVCYAEEIRIAPWASENQDPDDEADA